MIKFAVVSLWSNLTRRIVSIGTNSVGRADEACSFRNLQSLGSRRPGAWDFQVNIRLFEQRAQTRRGSA